MPSLETGIPSSFSDPQRQSTELEDLDLAQRTVQHAKNLRQSGKYSRELSRTAFVKIIEQFKSSGLSPSALKVLDAHLREIDEEDQ